MSGERGWISVLGTAGWDLARHKAPRSAPVAVAVVIAAFVAVTVLRWFVDGAGQAAELLYLVPIALGALRFGRRGGLTAAAGGAIAFVVLAAVHGTGDLDVTGWVGPLLAMGLVGVLVGSLVDVATRREELRTLQAQQARQLEVLCDEQQAAIRAGDSIVQQVAAVRWLLEAGRTQEAIAALSQTVTDGIAQVSCKLSLPGRDRFGAPPSPFEGTSPFESTAPFDPASPVDGLADGASPPPER